MFDVYMCVHYCDCFLTERIKLRAFLRDWFMWRIKNSTTVSNIAFYIFFYIANIFFKFYYRFEGW